MAFKSLVFFYRNFGARPIKRLAQELVETEIATKLLRGDFKEDSIIVDGLCDPRPTSFYNVTSRDFWKQAAYFVFLTKVLVEPT